MRKSYNKPDLNAPRFRKKCVTLLNQDLYERFVRRFPEHYNITLAEFKEIIKTFNGNLYKGAIDNRDGVELPEGLGFLFLGSCPPARKKNVNMGESIKSGVVTTYKNWDSDNMLLKIFYTNQTSKFPFQNKQIWSFKGVKQFRKDASDTYKKQWQKYIVVDNQKKISAMYAQVRKRDYILAQGAKIPEGYDEFKM